MHELGITENIISIVLAKAKEAQATRIMAINLVVGELSGFAPECIQFYFDSLKKDTIAQEAILKFESTPAQFRCRTCLRVFSPQGTLWTCPECQGQSLEIVGGRELFIQSMEVE